ncbi:hypothetical protein BGZ76_003068 [Entomortierella beljakovae]|nr:hypothetical protein BGZ76_003068 [Entomortierella beljakovae]
MARQRTPLQQLSNADSTTTKAATTTSTINTNRTSSSNISTTSANFPTVTASSITSISSIPSIAPTKSTSTITPSNSSITTKEKPKPKGGFFGSKSSGTNNNNNNTRNAVNLGSKMQGGKLESNSKTKPASTVDNNKSGSIGPMLLPLLPKLDDLDFSIPFLDEPTLTTTAVPTSKIPLPKSSTSNNGPAFSSFTPSKSQFLTSQSSKVQDYVGPSIRPPKVNTGSTQSSKGSIPVQSSRINVPPAMRPNVTTINASGAVPVDLSKSTVSDNSVNIENDTTTNMSSVKSSLNSRYGDGGDLDGDGTRGPIGASKSDDILNPPRFVIKQPSLTSGNSKSTTTPSTSKSSSIVSGRGSPQTSQKNRSYRHTLDIPLQLERQRQLSDASSYSGETREASLQRSVSASSAKPQSISRRTAVNQLQVENSPNPNFRSRLTRLFKSNPKPERPVSADRSQFDQKNVLKQSNVPSVSRQQALTRTPITQGQGQAQAQAQGLTQPHPQPRQQSQPQSKLQQKMEEPSTSPTLSPQQVPVTPPPQEQKQEIRDDEESVLDSVQESKSHSEEKPTAQSASSVSSSRPTSPTTPISSPASPQSFAPGLLSYSTSPPATPRSIEDNKARQRRVSSVSSSHSIRQVGTYGGGYVNPSKMISPARKANPYYSGVVARFANGGKHSIHDRDLSSSGRRRSLVSVSERAKVGTEASPSREKSGTLDQIKPTAINGRPPSITSTVNSAVYEATEKEDQSRSNQSDEKYTRDRDTAQKSSHATVSTAAPVMYTAIYSEEYGVEKDESVRNFPIARDNIRDNATASNDRSRFAKYTRGSTTSSNFEPQRDSMTQQYRGTHKYTQNGTHSVNTTWSTATGAHTDIGSTHESISTTTHTDVTYTDTRASYDSEDSDGDLTPSVSTFSSSLNPRDYRNQGFIITEGNWDDSESPSNIPLPVVKVQRPSMEISILPEQTPFKEARPMSPTSSINSASSKKRPQPLTSNHNASAAHLSESSYDSCGPLRWDELFEMDPNSKGPLWLSNRGIGQIPNEFFDGLRNLRELYLDHNDIKVVPDSLLKLSKLDVLDLSCNSISSFHSAFKMKKLKNLRRLNLDHNMLTDISPIYKLKALRELRLNYNFIPYLAIAIHGMTKLKVLAMESNQLSTLPETMGRLGNLCELRLSDNNIRVLPESIGSIRTLQVLALRSNLLEKLPESWKDMENLSTLDLACNLLTSLPSDIVRLPKLTHLDLHDNQIQTLPEKIGQLSNLVVLQLCNNNLQELPKDIGRLRDLQDLVLSFNQLQSLPDEIGKLNKLQELKFDNNPIRSLPRTIQRLINVRRIHLQGCELRDLPIEFGIAFKDLIFLDLSDNQFEVMPALDQMTKLEEFYISRNHLREIGTSSLILQGSGNSITGSASGIATGSSGVPHTLSRTTSAGGLGATSVGGQSGNASSNTAASQTTGLTGSSMGGGVTASKLHELKRLRVFEAQGNQIRILSSKIKSIPKLEVLDLGNNLLTWLPKEVGEITELKVLVLEGNPIKSLPSSLSKLMGSLEVFRIGEWPENGFEITREQTHVNMKINVLQSFLPQQIERTLLMRMHDSILKRVQELDGQQNSDQSDAEKAARAAKLSASANALVSYASQDNVPRSYKSITQGLTIATQHLMVNRSFALPPVTSSSGNSSADYLPVLNSEGINVNYSEYTPTNVRALPTLQLSNYRGHSTPITNLPLSASPQTASVPTGPLSSFPILNSLRPRKSQQQLAVKNGSGSRPKTMYAVSGQQQQDNQAQQPVAPRLTHRMSRVFDFSSNSSSSSKQKNDNGLSRIETLESSALQLSADAMATLGLGGQSGSTGNSVGFSLDNDNNKLGDGSLTNIRSSMAIKSSPSLISVQLPVLSSLTSVSVSGADSNQVRSTNIPVSLKRSASSAGGPNPDQNMDKSMTTLPWLRLQSDTPSPDVFEHHNDYTVASTSANSTTVSTPSPSSMLHQPTVNGLPISAPTPPPILLDYNLDSSLLDIPTHLYYSAGGDDVDGDHPDTNRIRSGDVASTNDETEDDFRSVTTGGEEKSLRYKNKSNTTLDSARVSHESHSFLNNQQTHFQLSATDPVLKIAILKGIYDQILHNVDQIVEQNVQESPAKKNSRFKLLNTLRFLKADRSGGSSSGSGSYQQHHGSLSSTFVAQHSMANTSQYFNREPQFTS